MTYIQFINYVFNWLSGTTVSGQTYVKYIEKCLEDEIELKPQTNYPAAFICPIPISLVSDNMAEYGCRIYVAGGAWKDTRFTVFSSIVTYN